MNEKGISITIDSYPYDRGCSSLITALPPWVRVGGIAETLTRIRDEETRKRIITEVENDVHRDEPAVWENWIRTAGFENIFISTIESEKWTAVTGLSINEIAKKQGLDEWDVFFDILLDDNGATWSLCAL